MKYNTMVRLNLDDDEITEIGYNEEEEYWDCDTGMPTTPPLFTIRGEDSISIRAPTIEEAIQILINNKILYCRVQELSNIRTDTIRY